MAHHKPDYCILSEEQKKYITNMNKKLSISTIASDLHVPGSVVSAFMLKAGLSFAVNKTRKEYLHKKKTTFNIFKDY